jgi:hypothetical protein
MKKTIFYMITCFAVACAIVSCSKKGALIPGITGTTDVYVAGGDLNEAVYWKNGVEVELPNGGMGSHATSIYVSGNDVYIAGVVGRDPVYWKNGVLNDLTDGIDSSIATSIFVANSKIYVGIYQGAASTTATVAEYLAIDGTGHSLETGVEGSGEHPLLYSTYVSGTNIYNAGSNALVVGSEGGHEVVFPYPCYWKNGAAVSLPIPTYFQNANHIENGIAYGVTVSGNDVYSAGYVGYGYAGDFETLIPYPVYWKNQTAYLLGAQTINNVELPNEGLATSIFSSGEDVYVGGYISTPNVSADACYWKNGGTTNFLPHKGIGSTGEAIYVSGSDVYEAGEDLDSQFLESAVYWKNGTEITLSTKQNSGKPYSGAGSIFVVQH